MIFLKQRAVAVFILILSLVILVPHQGQAQLLTGYQPSETYLSYEAEPVARQPILIANKSLRPGPSHGQAQIYRETTPSSPLSVPPSEESPVDLTADSLQHDEQTGVITASGNVELVQGARILRADTVSYNLNTDTVSAQGNLSVTEPNGDVHFADEAELSNEMRNGFVRSLQIYMAEGGYFTAEEGRRINEKITTMHNASYTPCDCDEDEGGNPAWQIKAKEITLDGEENQIRYKHARFEMFGVPVAYTPYFAHPDGKVKRKSGFIAPEVGFDSELGAVVTQNYYWDIAPHKDATIGLMLTTQEIPVALAQYRQRFEQAELEIEGSATYSNRNDSVAGQEVITDEEFRGHLFANTLWNINEKWRAGADIEVTTDDQYLRQYDFSGKDVLENEIYVERFSGRNYAVGRLLAFQDTRVEEEETDQPNILPEIEANFVGEPNQLLGGRWDLQVSALELRRDEGQDVTRLVTVAGWQRRDVTNFGLVNTLDLSVRGDAYHVSDRVVAEGGTGRSNEGSDTRFLPQAHLVSSYPFVKSMETMQAVIEPVVAMTVAPNIDDVDSSIPNEDSQDVQLDASNLFEPNRFPGKDRLEDRSRATYGVRTGLYGYGGSHGDVFIGQSYRLNERDNPFPNGSGLERQESDWVGQVAGVYDERFGVNYRFQLNGSDFRARRHEVDGYADFGKMDLSSRYLFADALGGTDIVESREQLFGAAAYELTSNWRVRGSVLEDLGEDPGLREATFGLDYFGCCLSFSATVERSITSDVSGDSGTSVNFRVGLKGLGEFQSPDSGTFSGRNY